MGEEAALYGEGISLRVDGAVATIVFDRQSSRNAMRLTTWRTIPSLIAAAEGDPAVGLILVRGAGRHFGAGNDITEFGALRGNPAAAEDFGGAMAAAMQAVEEASKPVIMAIEGVCYGAAVALTLAGDLRIAAENAIFSITPAKLGALYLRSDLDRLVAAIGVGQSKKLIYSAEPIRAAEALRIGLVDALIPEDRFEPDLRHMIEAVLAGSPFTLRRTKEMLRELGHGQAPRETSESLAPFVEATQGADFGEGVSAFLAKRTPRFGRRPPTAASDRWP